MATLTVCPGPDDGPQLSTKDCDAHLVKPHKLIAVVKAISRCIGRSGNKVARTAFRTFVPVSAKVIRSGEYTRPDPPIVRYVTTEVSDDVKVLSRCVGRLDGTVLAPVIVAFYPVPPVIAPGNRCTLKIATQRAARAHISEGVGDVTGASEVSVAPAATTEYQLTASNDAGSTSKTARVSVVSPTQPPRIDFFRVPPDRRDGDVSQIPGRARSLTWCFIGGTGTTATIVDDDGHAVTSADGRPLENVGSITVSPQDPTTYTLTVSNAHGPDATSQVTIGVLPRILGFQASSPTAEAGDTVTLTGVYQGGGTRDDVSISIDQGIGVVPTTAHRRFSRDVTVQNTTTWTVTATNTYGSVTSATTVRVSTAQAADGPVINNFWVRRYYTMVRDTVGSLLVGWDTSRVQSVDIYRVTRTGSISRNTLVYTGSRVSTLNPGDYLDDDGHALDAERLANAQRGDMRFITVRLIGNISEIVIVARSGSQTVTERHNLLTPGAVSIADAFVSVNNAISTTPLVPPDPVTAHDPRYILAVFNVFGATNFEFDMRLELLNNQQLWIRKQQVEKSLNLLATDVTSAAVRIIDVSSSVPPAWPDIVTDAEGNRFARWDVLRCRVREIGTSTWADERVLQVWQR